MNTSLQGSSGSAGEPPPVGRLVDGRYRVEARVAVGGMATVYRAVDTRLDRELALKVMHPSMAADSAFVERFIREAKSAARLAHPNVVGVFDQGADDSWVYLAMEYVSGCTLRDVLRDRGALRPRAALDVLEAMLAALGAAHRAGLVHRDMKPENVLIGDDGRVKVADFGLVRAVDTQTSAGTDTVLGTVSYLAPEQIEHGTADPRADLYACGVMLYEMLTGDKPHTGGTPAQVLYKHLHEGMPAPSASVPGLAPELDALVARGAGRDPAQRPDDAGAMLAETRTARSTLTDGQLDAVPPQAKSPADTAGTPEPRLTGQEGGVGPVSGPVPVTGSGTGAGGPSAPEAPQASASTPGSEDRTSALPRPAMPPPSHDQGMYDSAPYGQQTYGQRAYAQQEFGHGTHPSGGDDPGLDNTARLAAVPPGRQPDESRAGAPAGRRRHGWLFVAVLVLALVALVGTGVWYINSGQFTRAPAVLDKTQSEATKAVDDAGLDIRVTHAYSNRKRGHVVDSDPAPGARVRKTGTIHLTVSRGPHVETVPDLAGTPLSDAERKLKDLGLKPGVVKRRFDEETARGSVIGTTPHQGTKRRTGSAVTLTVSRGAPVDIPDVVGEDRADAEQELHEAGLKVRLAKRRVFSTEDKGSIARQSPKDGDTVAKGRVVTLAVSKGPDMVEVPDVEDLSADKAEAKLKHAGFGAKKHRLFFGDTVFNQTPDSGEKAPRGSDVSIWVR